MFSRRMPKKGDIFNRSKPGLKLRAPRMHYRPMMILRSVGIVAFFSVVLLGMGILFPTKEQSYKQLATPAEVSTPPFNGTTTEPITDVTTDTVADTRSPKNWYDDWDNNPVQVPNTNTYPINITPINNTGLQNPGNLGSISSAIISSQQQIGGQMQGCINNARQMANQIINMKNQEKQLQKQIDTLYDQIWKIDTSRPGGQKKADAMTAQMQQLQRQLDNYTNSIYRAQDQYSTNNSRCRENIDRYIQQREDLESRLNDAFNQSMDIQFPN